MGMKTDAFEALNKVIDKWNDVQPYLLITKTDARNIYVRPHASDGWQRFIAIDVEFQNDDGPFGFGKTEADALNNLVTDPHYQRLIAPPSSADAPDPKPASEPQ